ncbi:sensor histidine kinase [Nocardia transvalensis]|nr:sensor histidine kinase [Nocardia transvalensis]
MRSRDRARDPAALGVWQQGWRLLAAALIGVGVWLINAGKLPPGTGGMTLVWLFVADPLIAVVCLALVMLRRRYPLAITAIVNVASSASALANGAALLALCSLATRRRYGETVPMAVVCVITGLLTDSLYPKREGQDSFWYLLAVTTLAVCAVVAVGFAVGARRETVSSLQQRAEIAEREQVARAAEARILERHRIAREMHDVLAHRISLIAMQAGALGYRTDLETEQVTTIAKSIADSSHQALEELRDILGVLRSDRLTDDDRPEPPQPSLGTLPTLVADARASGLVVTFDDSTIGEPPVTSARTAYRVVQEGLTNVGKHAPGATVWVGVGGSAGQGLQVTVRDSGATRAASAAPTSGFGLLGLTERVELAGGTLSFGPDPDGGFRLHAGLPWPARASEAST